MRKKLTVTLVAFFIAILCTAVFSACGESSGSSDKCYYELPAQFPDYVSSVYIDVNMMSSDNKGDYIAKGTEFKVVIETENAYYDASALQVSINGTSYGVTPDDSAGGIYKTESIKAESDFQISVTGTVTETTESFTLDCPSDSELSAYYTDFTLLNDAQKESVTVTFDNYDTLAKLNPDTFGSGKTIGKSSYTYKEFQQLFTDGQIDITAGKASGVKISISFEELEGFNTVYAESMKLVQDEWGLSPDMYSVPFCATVSESNGKRTVKYDFDLMSYNYDYVKIFAPYLYIDEFEFTRYDVLSDYSYNGLDTGFFEYDEVTRTIGRTENRTVDLDDVYAATTLYVNDTELGKFSVSSYTLDKKPYEYYSDWNGKQLDYYDYYSYDCSVDFVQTAYKLNAGITYDDFVKRFDSITGDYDLTGTMPLEVKDTENNAYANSATVEFLKQDSFSINDKQIYFYVYDCSYTIKFRGLSDLPSVGSTITITMNDTAYVYEYSSIDAGDHYYGDWVCTGDGPELGIGLMGGTDEWHISNIPVQYVPESIEFYAASEI